MKSLTIADLLFFPTITFTSVALGRTVQSGVSLVVLGLYYHNILAQFSFGRVGAPWCALDAEARETLVAPAWDEFLATNRTSRRLNSLVPLHSPVTAAKRPEGRPEEPRKPPNSWNQELGLKHQQRLNSCQAVDIIFFSQPRLLATRCSSASLFAVMTVVYLKRDRVAASARPHVMHDGEW